MNLRFPYFRKLSISGESDFESFNSDRMLSTWCLYSNRPKQESYANFFLLEMVLQTRQIIIALTTKDSFATSLKFLQLFLQWYLHRLSILVELELKRGCFSSEERMKLKRFSETSLTLIWDRSKSGSVNDIDEVANLIFDHIVIVDECCNRYARG